MANKYRIEIFWSDENEGFIANVPELRYCSAFGKTPNEALDEVQKAIKLHAEALRHLGRPVSEDLRDFERALYDTIAESLDRG